MATSFQPQLKGSAVLAAPTTVSSLDFSGVASGIANIFANTARDRAAWERQQADNAKEAQKLRNAMDTADLQDDLISLHQEREEGILAEQNLRDRLVSLQQSGEIGPEQVAEFDSLSQQLESLKQFRAQGLGNDTVFRIKRNELLRQAQGANPLIYDEIRSLFSHALGDPTSSGSSGNVSGGSVPNQAVLDNLRAMYGNSFGIEEYNKYLKNQTIIANYETNKKLGAITAANIFSHVDSVVDASLYQWEGELAHALGQHMMLTPEQEHYFQRKLLEEKQRAYAELDQLYNRAAQNQEIIDIDSRRAAYSRVDQLYQDRASLLQDKDIYTRTKQHMELRDIAIMHSLPDIVRIGFSVGGKGGGLGGAENMQNMAAILTNPILTSAASATTHPWLAQVSASDKQKGIQAIAEAYGTLVNGVPMSPTMQRDADRISTYLMGTVPKGHHIDENVVKNAGKALERASGGMNPDLDLPELPANIMDAAKTAMDPVWASNFAEKATAADKKHLNALSTNWAATALSKANEHIMLARESYRGKGTPPGITYNPQSQQFEVANTPLSGQLMGPMNSSVRSAVDLRLKEDARLLNTLLDLSKSPDLQGIVPSHQDIVDEFHKAQEAIQQLIDEAAEERARQAEERRAAKEAREAAAAEKRASAPRGSRIPFSSPAVVIGSQAHRDMQNKE